MAGKTPTVLRHCSKWNRWYILLNSFDIFALKFEKKTPASKLMIKFHRLNIFRTLYFLCSNIKYGLVIHFYWCNKNITHHHHERISFPKGKGVGRNPKTLQPRQAVKESGIQVKHTEVRGARDAPQVEGFGNLGWFRYMGVSENSGTPKSSILIGFSIIHHPFWGTPTFGNTQKGDDERPRLCEVYNTWIRFFYQQIRISRNVIRVLITAHLCKVRAGPARLIGKVIFEDHWGDKCVRYQKPLRVRGRLPPRHMEEGYVSLIRKYSPNLEGWNFSWCMVSSQSVLCSLKPSKVSLTPNGAFLLGVLGRVRNS